MHSVDRHFTKSAEDEGEMGHLRLIKKIPVTKSFEVFMGKLWFDEFFTVGYVYNVEKWASIPVYDNSQLEIAEYLRLHTICIRKPNNEIEKHLASRAESGNSLQMEIPLTAIDTFTITSPAESLSGDLNPLESGDSTEVSDREEEQSRNLQRKKQRNAKRDRNDKNKGRKHRHNVVDIHALQHKKGSPASVSKPIAKRGRDDDEGDMISERQQNNTVDQRASKKKCDISAKDRRILSDAFFELVEKGGGEIRYDVKEDPWGLSKKRNVAKGSWEMSTKRFDDEITMLDAAIIGTSLN
ncbi:hypothetical protein BPAE_0080g00190 [Botrytis paeoniae]|uniref:Uncharacterized protein n=1 Tax=Botrytis paeoniae TaxID=278948 RepID=A0A4Z1FPD1_9HELO|nr:hypothetical protein BPAE_0080g00190 [Botrytis paeoniae]